MKYKILIILIILLSLMVVSCKKEQPKDKIGYEEKVTYWPSETYGLERGDLTVTTICVEDLKFMITMYGGTISTIQMFDSDNKPLTCITPVG